MFLKLPPFPSFPTARIPDNGAPDLKNVIQKRKANSMIMVSGYQV
jgi:hypothetical protein